MIGAVLVFALAVLLGALLRCLDPAPRPKDVYVAGRRVEIVTLPKFAFPVSAPTGTWVGELMELYVAVMLDGLLLRGLSQVPEIRFTPEAARQFWLDETKRLREEAKRGRLGGRLAPRIVFDAPDPKPAREESPYQRSGHWPYQWSDRRSRIVGETVAK